MKRGVKITGAVIAALLLALANQGVVGVVVFRPKLRAHLEVASKQGVGERLLQGHADPRAVLLVTSADLHDLLLQIGDQRAEEGAVVVQHESAVASDHAGFTLKKEIIEFLAGRQHEVFDLGTRSGRPVDYPDSALTIGETLLAGKADRGILICGSGVGACIAANKMLGIRAGLCHDTYSARQGVEHDDMNVLCLGARVIGFELAMELVRAFLAARFVREERYLKRLKKVHAIEERNPNN